MGTPFTVGVLALQGAFSEHVEMCRQAAARLQMTVSVTEVRSADELKTIDGMFRSNINQIAATADCFS